MGARAILFDLDGTIVDTERESAEAMARALDQGLGIRVTDRDRDSIIGRSWVEIHRDLQRTYPALTWTRDQLIAETSKIRELIFDEQGIEPLPGVLEALDHFCDLPMAIVTGSSRAEAEHALRVVGIRDRFTVLYAAEDVPTSKPHPEGYLRAASSLGVDPAHCLVVEDSTAGIAAGRAAGAVVVAVEHGNFAGQDQSEAHLVIASMTELTLDLVRPLFSGRGGEGG